MSTLIELHAIKKTYHVGTHRVEALKGIDLTVEKSDFMGIIGVSGSGKSTLMNILGLLDSPDEGRYLLEGRDVSTLSFDERATLRNQTIGFVFQSFFLLPRLTALQNVALPLLYRGISEKERIAQALSLLKKVGMGEHGHHKPSELSGGQQQRVAIARALVGNPSLLLADEPTGALDSKTGKEVLDIFRHLNKEEGMSTLIITHDSQIAEQCQHIIRLQDGEILL